jgi:hypothetical protein
MSGAPTMLADPAQVTRERLRRQVVRLVVIVYWLLVVEGALRKWALPSAQQALFFIRDPFALLAMMLALRARLVPFGRLFAVVGALALAMTCIAGYQMVANGFPVQAALIGLRSYVFYAAFAVVVAAVMRREDLYGVVRWTLWSCIPMAVLTAVQHVSPPSAFINASYSGGEVFTVAEGVVRTTGTFTFTAGMACFIGMGMACLCAAYYRQLNRPLMTLPAFVATALALAACLAISGSRTAFVMAAITVLAFVGAELCKPAGRQRLDVLIGVPVLLVFLGGFVALFFADGISALIDRQAGATRGGEDFVTRMLTLVGPGAARMDWVPPLGAGIGATSGAGQASGVVLPYNPESEIERILVDLGMVPGLVYVAFRWGLLGWMLIAGLQCVRRNEDSLPLLLWSTTAPHLFNGLLVNQGTINGYGWICTGLTIAALATSAPAPQPSAPPLPGTAPAPRGAA